MQIVTKLHSRCNINCTYCYMYNLGDASALEKPKFLSWNAILEMSAMINSWLDENGGSVSVSIHGGEPLLFGKKNFERMMAVFDHQVDRERVKFTLQTNATLVDAAWVELFNRFSVCVSASLDGPQSVNDISRVDHRRLSSFLRAERGIRLLQSSGVDFAGVICVVQPDADGASVVDYFINDLGVQWFDLLLPDYSHDHIRTLDWKRVQDRLARYMIDAFETWVAYLPGGPSCRFFESIIAKGFGRHSGVDTIGTSGVQSIVLETDGTLEPHDVARICDGVDRFTGIKVGKGAMQELLKHPNYSSLTDLTGVLSAECNACPLFTTCRGGHLFHRYSKEAGFGNRSVHCHVLKETILHIHQRMGDMFQEAARGQALRLRPTTI